MSNLINLEIKKYHIYKHLKYILIIILLVILYFVKSLTDSFNDPLQTKDNFKSIVSMIEIFIGSGSLIYAAIWIGKMVVGEYSDRTILNLFSYPVKKKSILLAKLVTIEGFSFVFLLLGYFSCLFFAYDSDLIYDAIYENLTMQDIIWGMQKLMLYMLFNLVAIYLIFNVGLIVKSSIFTMFFSIGIVILKNPLLSLKCNINEFLIKVGVVLIVGVICNILVDRKKLYYRSI